LDGLTHDKAPHLATETVAAATPTRGGAIRFPRNYEGMDWDTEALPLLKAVGSAIERNDGAAVSAEMVNAELERPLAEDRLDRQLDELFEDDMIRGPRVMELGAPVAISLTPKGRQQVSGWPSASSRGSSVSISGSNIGNLALRDLNVNVNISNFFEAWEQKIEKLEAPSEEKQAAREKVRMAKDILTGATGGAGGRALYEAFPLLFG
jgi:hypothetical protein